MGGDIMPIIRCQRCGRKVYEKDLSLFCDMCKITVEKEKRIIPLWKVKE
jgi:hypothetical protein